MRTAERKLHSYSRQADCQMINPEQSGNPLNAFQNVGHALFSKDGVKLAFGRHWNGSIIHISQATRGGSCGCVCPAGNCGRKLVAKKPDTKRFHHFAHAPLTLAEREAGIAPNCKHGNMTALHEYAERLLESKKSIFLPPVRATYRDKHVTVREAGHFAFNSAKLETMNGETIPDVILYKGEEYMHVEVYVTNRCSDHKRAKIKNANISALEIDLSKQSRDITFAGLDDAILNTAPREWLHNRKQETAQQELVKEAQDELIRQANWRRRKSEEIRVRFTRTGEALKSASPLQDTNVVFIENLGQRELIEWQSEGFGFFTVHPQNWQAAVLCNILSSLHECSAFEIANALEARRWINRNFAALSNERDSLWLEAMLPIGGPAQVILKYLEFLSPLGIVRRNGTQWGLTKEFSKSIQECEKEQQRLIVETQNRESRNAELKTLVKKIVECGENEEAIGFRKDYWLAQPLESCSSLSPFDMIQSGGSMWFKFIKQLQHLLGVLKDETDGAADTFDLPIIGRFNQIRSAQNERAAAIEKLALEKIEAERMERIQKLRASVNEQLLEEDRNWIEQDCNELNGLSPIGAAAQSEAHLNEALRRLRIFAEVKSEKRIWVAELERKVRMILKSPDHVQAFLKGPHPELNHYKSKSLTPNAFTVDQATMEQCIRLLSSWPKKKGKS
jgi:hypothetical protein